MRKREGGRESMRKREREGESVCIGLLWRREIGRKYAIEREREREREEQDDD